MTIAQKLALYKELTRILEIAGEGINIFVHHGSCIGADEEFHYIAKSLCLPVIIHPPINQYKMAKLEGDEVRQPKDYLKRNHDIVNESGFIFGCPSGDVQELRSGTWATLRYAKKMNKLFRVIYPGGAVIQGSLPPMKEEL